MPNTFDFGGVNLTAGGESSVAHPSPETSFRIAILGDFSGRANRGISEANTIGKRRAVPVDRDNFDEVLSRSGVEIQLAIGDGSLHLRFSELDDFHPDRIFQNLAGFQQTSRVTQPPVGPVYVSGSGAGIRVAFFRFGIGATKGRGLVHDCAQRRAVGFGQLA